MGLAYVLRLGLKHAFSRKRSAVAFTALLLLSMTLCGTLIQASMHIQSATAEAIRVYCPDIVLLGYFPPSIISIAKSVEGVEKVACISVVNVVAEGRKGSLPAILAYGNSIYSRGLFAVAYTTRPRGFEILLTPRGAYELGVRRGETIKLCRGALCVEARVAGYYSSISAIGYGLALLGTQELISKLGAGYCTVLAVSVGSGASVEEVVKRLVEALREHGAVVRSYHIVSKSAEILSKVAAIRGMTLSVTSAIAIAIAFMALVSAALTIVSLERELSTIGVLRAVGMTSRQLIAVYSVGKILIVVISAAIAIAVTPVLGYSFATALLNAMGLTASLVKPFVKLAIYPSVIVEEVLLFVPIPTALLLAPGLAARRISVVRALNPYLSSDSYAAKSSLATLRWSPWLALLRRRLSRAVMYIVVLALLATPVLSIAMLSAGYAVREQYALSTHFDTLIFTSPQYYGVLRQALRGAQLLEMNTSWRLVEGHAILVNYVNEPRLLKMVAPLIAGRYPQKPGEAVVTLTVAKLLGVGIGDEISVGGKSYRVVGIVRYYVENGLDIFVYSNGGGGTLMCFVKGVKPSEVWRILKNLGVLARVVSAESYLQSVASGTSMVLGIVSAPLLLACLVLLGGLLMTIATDLSVNAHHIAVLKCVGTRSRDIAAWIVKALLPLMPIATPIALALAYALSNFIATSLATSFAYDPPKLSTSAITLGLATTFLIALLAGYIVSLTIVKRIKASNINLLTV